MLNNIQIRAYFSEYNTGVFFVTACVLHHQNLFGEIINGVAHYSILGKRLIECIEYANKNYKDVEIIPYVVMPNHFHMVVYIDIDPESTLFSRIADIDPERKPVNMGALKPKEHFEDESELLLRHFNSRLSQVCTQIKGGVTRFANNNGIYFKWQRRFHDHIIRNDRDLKGIIQYIENNIGNWTSDEYYSQ